MTRPRFDNKSTPFGLWLREQPEIDSHLGFWTYNLDFLWSNMRRASCAPRMLLEEKQFLGEMAYGQAASFKWLDNMCRADPNYRGFHLIQFAGCRPDDGGQIFLDKLRVLAPEELIAFLRFEAPPDWYTSYFDTGPDRSDMRPWPAGTLSRWDYSDEFLLYRARAQDSRAS